MIKIKDLKVTFKDTVALDIDREIVIDSGQKVGIIGSNGAGKSTLINAIIGAVSYKGKIENSVKHKDIAVHLQQNGYNEIVDAKTIMEAVLGEDIKGNDRLNELIDFFDFRHCLNKKYKQLSGGEKQKLTIMLIIMQDGPLTIYDEVTSGLDFETRGSLMRKLNEMYLENELSNQETKTILVVSHYYEELERLVDSVLLLEKGKVVAFGNVEELFKKYCGDHIVIANDNDVTRAISKKARVIAGPKDKIVLSFDNAKDSEDIIKELTQAKESFTVTAKDIEVMTINAKEEYFKGGN